MADPNKPLLEALTVARDALDAWEYSSKESDQKVRDKLFYAADVVRRTIGYKNESK